MPRNRVPAILSIVVVILALALAAIGASSATGPNPAPLTQASVVSCTTDANGYCTVTHSLGVVPEAAVVTAIISQGWQDYHLSVVNGSLTATSVKVRAMRTDTTPRANLPITFSLVVYGSAPAPTSTTAPTTTTTPPATTTTTTPPPTTPPVPSFPSASNTGVPSGTQLEVVNGDVNLNTTGAQLIGKDVRGCVSVSAPGVVIRNSRITGACGYVVDNYGYSGTGLLIEDSEVSCPPGNGGTAIGEENVTVHRLNVFGCENGFDVDRSFTIEDSYIHDLYQSAEAHTDGIQMWSTVVGVTIRHNTIYANTGSVGGTSAIISPSAGTVDVLIENNLLAGGAYTLYCRQAGAGINYRVIDNHFSTVFYPTVGAFGPWTDCQDEAQVTGNVYHDGPNAGQPVPF